MTIQQRGDAFVRSALALLLASVPLTTQPVEAQAQSDYVCRGFAVPTDVSGMPMATTNDGVVWYVAKNSNRLIRVEKDHSFSAVVPVDGSTGQVTGMTLAPDGAIWYSKNTSHRMGRIPSGGGKGVEFELPAPNVFTSAIAAGADGRIWYVDPVVNKVGYITVDGNVVTYDAPSVNGMPLDPAGIAVAADGSVWVTSVGLNAVFRVDPGSGAFTRFDIATPNAQPGEITRGPNGDLWFNMRAIGKIGRITTAGTITEYPANVIGIDTLALGPDGAMWYSSNQDVGRLDTVSGRVETFACAGGGGMTIGPDKRLWVLGSGNGQMYEVALRGAGTAARVAAVGDTGASVATVSADQVVAMTGSASGRVVVQYSSSDPRCGYCVIGNRHYDDLVSTENPKAKYVRVLYEPWTSASGSTEAKRVHLVGLPTIIVFENGKETSRFSGDATPEVMRSKLHL
jgi:virginiamycin B lyase